MADRRFGGSRVTSPEPPPLREVVERTAQAVMSGNFMALMADITPEALGKLMQMAPSAGQMNLAALPQITGYQVDELAAAGEVQRYRVTFQSALGTVTLASHWKQVLGQWKIADFDEVQFDLAPPAAAEG